MFLKIYLTIGLLFFLAACNPQLLKTVEKDIEIVAEEIKLIEEIK